MNNIRKLRLNRGWTQKQLAVKVHTVHQHIQRLESGKRGLSEKWINKLKGVFQCTRDELFDDPQSIEKGLSEPSISPALEDDTFDLLLYRSAVDNTIKFCKSRKITLSKEVARDFIEKVYLRLHSGHKLDNRVLEIYYEDMVPPKNF